MNARCGLEDCDCEYIIGGLLEVLEKLSVWLIAPDMDAAPEMYAYAHAAIKATKGAKIQ